MNGYRFCNLAPEVKAENGHFKYLITSKTKDYILKKYMESKCLDCTIKKLRKENKIDKRISESSFKRGMQEYKPYQKAKKQERIDYKKLKENVIRLKSKGVSYKKISEETGEKYAKIWNIINKNRKAKKNDLKRSCLTVTRKAKRIVKDWNKNNYKGRIASKQTIEAFNFLGLQIESLPV